jgi:hypothetical protein
MPFRNAAHSSALYGAEANGDDVHTISYMGRDDQLTTFSSSSCALPVPRDDDALRLMI